MTSNEPSSSGATVEAVVFDMGGVVVQLGSLPDVLAGSGLTDEEIWNRWILSDAVRRYERGIGTVDEFATHLIDEFNLDIPAETVLERFARFPQGLYPGAAEMVAAVRARVPVGVLSNTNELHWTAQQDHAAIQAMFDHRYLSYELGMVKPDADIYERVVADLGLDAAAILFIDDNRINVDGAIAVGMQGAVAKGPAETTASLRRLGVLD